MIFITTEDYDKATHEEIPKEEIWEDGELNDRQMQDKIINHVTHTGKWILIRKVYNG
mgnify:CR=1 FL=1|tara:strand:- start:654 stop:824 length:171 start_codon:yes stop_codon:yes gene_type:complete